MVHLRHAWSPSADSDVYNDLYFILDGVFHYWRDAEFGAFNSIYATQ